VVDSHAHTSQEGFSGKQAHHKHLLHLACWEKEEGRKEEEGRKNCQGQEEEGGGGRGDKHGTSRKNPHLPCSLGMPATTSLPYGRRKGSVDLRSSVPSFLLAPLPSLHLPSWLYPLL